MFGSDATFPEMDDVDRQAWMIAIGEANGAEWNFRAWEWVQRKG